MGPLLFSKALVRTDDVEHRVRPRDVINGLVVLLPPLVICSPPILVAPFRLCVAIRLLFSFSLPPPELRECVVIQLPRVRRHPIGPRSLRLLPVRPLQARPRLPFS